MEPGRDDTPKPHRYWVPGARTRFHRYFYPSDSRPGIALMLLIGILGLLAVAMASRHLAAGDPAMRQSRRLVAIGLLAMLVGFWQAWSLGRRKKP